jgi:hypothetical protein
MSRSPVYSNPNEDAISESDMFSRPMVPAETTPAALPALSAFVLKLNPPMILFLVV